jgi:hypothetical protein
MQVIEELIKLAKDLDAATKAGKELGLTDDEKAFYDALAANESAVAVMGDDKLKLIASELITQVKKSVTIDWTLRESARAKIAARSYEIGRWLSRKFMASLYTQLTSAVVSHWFKRVNPGTPSNSVRPHEGGKTKRVWLSRCK